MHTYTLDDIKVLVDGQSYLVHLQSDPSRKYIVDIDNYTCECNAYPSISYCKHICAVQLLFPESVESRPFTSICTLLNNDKTHKSDVETTPVPKDNAQTNTTTNAAAFVQLSNKLQALTVHIRLAMPQSFTVRFNELGSMLDLLLEETKAAHVLPKPAKITPNKHSRWAETKAVMHQPVKSKHARTHTDPYSAGKASGTMAKPDAKRAKKENEPPATRYIYHCLVHFPH